MQAPLFFMPDQIVFDIMHFQSLLDPMACLNLCLMKYKKVILLEL